MKQILPLALVLLALFIPTNGISQSNEDEITTYYLIRHAEKDRSDKTNPNPNLNETGLIRADNWANVFKEVPFDILYSTNYYRTRETAGPTAIQKGLTIKMYDPKYLYDDIFKLATLGKTVLVVGHSNTTPDFVNAIIGKNTYNHIDDLDNGSLFIVRVSKTDTFVTVLHID